MVGLRKDVEGSAEAFVDWLLEGFIKESLQNSLEKGLEGPRGSINRSGDGKTALTVCRGHAD